MSHARLTKRTRYGFTLIELIVTVVILAILAALAVPALRAVQDRSRDEVLEAELEALGRGVAALAAFDGGGVTAAHVEEFLAGENAAATALVTSSRWDLYADGDAPETPATGDLLVAASDGYVGLATPAGHRAGQVAYAVVGTAGAVAQLTDVVDADGDTAAMRGADALCFYGADGTCPADATAEPVPGTSSSAGNSEPVAPEPAAVAWVATAAGPGSSYSGLGVFEHPDGGSLTTATFNGEESFGATTLTSVGAGSDLVIAKTGADGQWQWATRAGGDHNADRFWGVTMAADGSVYVGGEFQSTMMFGDGPDAITAEQVTVAGVTGGRTAYVARLDPTGQWAWVKTFASDKRSAVVQNVAADPDGTVAIVGYFNGSLTLGSKTVSSASQDLFLATVTADGQFTDLDRIGGTGPEYAYGLAVNAQGDRVLTGVFHSSTTIGSTTLTSTDSSDGFVTTISRTGTPLRVSHIKGPGGERFSYVSLDADGNAYVAGYVNGASVTVGGRTLQLTASRNDLAAFRINAGVNSASWLVTAAASGAVVPSGITADADAVYVSGYYAADVTFGTTPTLGATGVNTGFLAAADAATGSWQWSDRVTGTTSGHVGSVALRSTDELYVTGTIRGTGVVGTVDVDNPELFTGVWHRQGSGPVATR